MEGMLMSFMLYWLKKSEEWNENLVDNQHPALLHIKAVKTV